MLRQKKLMVLHNRRLQANNSVGLVRPCAHVGDEGLDHVVTEEFKQNCHEENERFRSAQQGSSWLGKVISNTFNFEGKTDFDFPLVEVKKYVATKVDGQTRADTLFLEEMK